jgi:hypothetical protein
LMPTPLKPPLVVCPKLKSGRSEWIGR